MAKRPIFVPLINGKGFVLERYVDFEWHAGFAKSQKQKSIRAFHEMAFREYGVRNPLEVSSKSESPLGVALSSFNLSFETMRGRTLTVEAAFQGSKVFESGGPYRDIFDMKPIDAKRDVRLRNSGPLRKFSFFGTDWGLEPKTAFYDWLYINALMKNELLASQVTDVDGFSDIEFNPEKSINCQARAAALYSALFHSESSSSLCLPKRHSFLCTREKSATRICREIFAISFETKNNPRLRPNSTLIALPRLTSFPIPHNPADVRG